MRCARQVLLSDTDVAFKFTKDEVANPGDEQNSANEMNPKAAGIMSGHI